MEKTYTHFHLAVCCFQNAVQIQKNRCGIRLYVTVHAKKRHKFFCGLSTNSVHKNLVSLARCVSEWLLLYTGYKNTRLTKRQFLYVHHALRKFSVYELCYMFSVDTAQRSACTAVFREEGLGKTKKEAQ